MTITRILAPVRGDGKGEGVLAHAVAVARRFNAHIEVVHCRARPEDMIPYGVVVPASMRERLKADAKTLADEEEAYLRGLFEELMDREGVAVIADTARPPGDRPSASWHEAEGKQIDVIKRHGRLADLLAVAKPDRDRNLGTNTLKAALFSSGRPVLLCPVEAPPADFTEHVAVAWNGSLEVARAVALALPILDRAERATVFDGGGGEGADGRAFARYLDQRGIAAARQEIVAGDDPGAALLAAAKAAGASLLVMGAYGHSRDLEAVLGGATQVVVDKTDLPIVFAH